MTQMKIVVCYKNVPDEQNLSSHDDRTLDLSGAAYGIEQYDLNAVQAAMDIAACCEAEVVALTVAGDVIDNSKLRKAILSRGPAKMVGVKAAGFERCGSYVTATALAEAIRRMGDVDLVLFGEGSGDMYAQVTGSLTCSLLGWPTLNAVSSISVDGGTAKVSRSLEHEDEHYSVTLPAMFSVTADINRPKIPSMKEILGAGKKPVEVIEDIAPVADGTSTVSVLAPEKCERKNIIFEALDDNAAETIAAQIKKVI